MGRHAPQSLVSSAARGEADHKGAAASRCRPGPGRRAVPGSL